MKDGLFLYQCMSIFFFSLKTWLTEDTELKLIETVVSDPQLTVLAKSKPDQDYLHVVTLVTGLRRGTETGKQTES